MKHQIIRYMPAFTLVLFVMLFLCCTPGNASKEHILFDFESDRELDEVNWQCHTLMSISDLHATHGKSSLKLEMYPSAYPGFSPFLSVNDWSKYKSLCFDVYNPDETEIRITVRIDDTKDNTEYKERYNQQFVLKKEMNHIRIDMESLVTSGTGRRMNSSTIDKFLIFSSSPVKKIVLYIDHIRLDTN